ncbi:MAG: metallophosphoesterase family protein, partial [Steroidobacteraceae bacterium]
VAVLSGDLTQRARRSQFAAARRFADELNAPRCLAIPGNHDIPLFNVVARALHPYANYERAFGTNLEPEFESPGLLIVCVNTTRPTRHKDGEVSSEQVERVARRLRVANREQLRVVVTHQPVHVVRASDIENLLHGHEAAVRAWCAAGADIIMGGHIHLPYVRELSGHLPGLPRKTWAVQAGTAVSSRIRANIPNSVNVIRHEAGDLACTVERWDYDAPAARFKCFEQQRLELER